MIQEVYRAPGGSFRWIDVVAPEPAELRDLAKQYGLQPNAVQDCLEPWHLPKFERFGSVLFFIVRAYDERSDQGTQVNFAQQMTRKLAVFVKPEVILTIHRSEMPFFAALQRQYLVPPAPGTDRAALGIANSPVELLLQVIHEVGRSYSAPLQEAERTMDDYEFRVFQHTDEGLNFKEFYFFKRRVALIKKMLRLQLDILAKLDPFCSGPLETVRQDVRETLDQLYFQSDELVNDATSLTGVFINIASHRTNGIIRVLTVFSVFFLPLTFIAGIYGMNFEFMPELKWRLGYPFSLALMAGVTLVIYVWFRRKGWL